MVLATGANLGRYPLEDRLRGEPEFKDIIRKMGVSE